MTILQVSIKENPVYKMLSFGLMKRPEEYSSLTEIIQGVNTEVIAMKKESKAVTVRIMDKVVDHVVKKLAVEDETFQLVYNGVRPVGSYFDGLRVKESTEFDVNVVLKFPFHRKCKVESSKPGFVRVCVKSWMEVKKDMGKIYAQKVRRKIDSKLDQMVDLKGYIRRDKILDWWRSIFTKALPLPEEVTFENHKYLIKWTTSGPAAKIHVIGQDTDVKMDIDMVPVIRCSDAEARYPTFVYQSHQTNNSDAFPKEWYIVPKPLNDDDTNRRWRLSFTDQEKILMRKKEHLKPINRLMKRLRDKSNWKELNSYMIKTIFLLETGHDSSFYSLNLGCLFVFALVKLRGYLERKKLPFYWHKKRNLFRDIPRATSNNIGGHVKRILTTIHSLLESPTELEKYVRSLLI